MYSSFYVFVYCLRFQVIEIDEVGAQGFQK